MIRCSRCDDGELHPTSNKYCTKCGFPLDRLFCQACKIEVSMSEEPSCPQCEAFVGHLLLAQTRTEGLEQDAMIVDRYRVKAVLSPDRCELVDTKPNHSVEPQPVSETTNRKVSLYQALKDENAVPALYDYFQAEDRDWILLQAACHDSRGNSFPTLREKWRDPVTDDGLRIKYLLSHLNLFAALVPHQAVGGWLAPDNIRVDADGVIRLEVLGPESSSNSTDLGELAHLWSELVFDGVETPHDFPLCRIIAQMQQDKNIDKTRNALELLKRDASRRVNLQHAAETNIGRLRTNNEDNFLALTCEVQTLDLGEPVPVRRGLYIVCDGMGGHEAGEVASALAIDKIEQSLLPLLSKASPPREQIELQLESAVMEANTAVYQRNVQERRDGTGRMGTTVVLALVLDRDLYVVHVGDSRLYRLGASNGVEQVTTDHNVANRDIRLGLISPEQAKDHPQGQQLTQALGPKPKDFVHPDVQSSRVTEACTLLLCSDGLTDLVEDKEIGDIVRANPDDLGQAVLQLIQTANDRGGHDNITIVLLTLTPSRPLFPTYRTRADAETDGPGSGEESALLEESTETVEETT